MQNLRILLQRIQTTLDQTQLRIWILILLKEIPIMLAFLALAEIALILLHKSLEGAGWHLPLGVHPLLLIIGIIKHLIGDGVEQLLGQEHTNLGNIGVTLMAVGTKGPIE